MVCLYGDNAVRTLHNRYVRIGKHKAHHGAACLDGDIVANQAAAVVNQILGIGTNLYNKVARIFQSLTGHGHDTLYQRHTLLDRVGNGLCGADVAHNAAHICRQAAAGHLSSCHALDQHLLSALGIFGLCFYYFNIVNSGSLLFHQLDGIRLVVLNDNHALLGAHCLDDSL